MIRRSLAVIVVVIVVAFIAQRLFGDRSVEPTVKAPVLTAAIGSGSDAVGVDSTGRVVPWLPVPDEPSLPALPLTEVPKSGHLAGPVLEQAHVLGAAPAALRPYIARSYLGESGIDVDLTTGIELRFGDASEAALKWKAAAAILADPSITALDYVDLHAPDHPAVGGSGHTLPTVP